LDGNTHHPKFKSPVIAAIETCAAQRLKDSREGDTGQNGPTAELNNIDRTAIIVEAASAKIKANDFSAVEALFAGQAFALDAMFDKLARDNTVDDIRFALRAQAQCRATFRTLMQMKNPQVENFLRKRSVQSGESPG